MSKQFDSGEFEPKAFCSAAFASNGAVSAVFVSDKNASKQKVYFCKCPRSTVVTEALPTIT
jgi:hypothetical protein